MKEITPFHLLRDLGSKANIARHFRVKPPSVTYWFKSGRVPPLRQYQYRQRHLPPF